VFPANGAHLRKGARRYHHDTRNFADTMTRSATYALAKALALSIFLHAALLAMGLRLPVPPPGFPRPAEAQLTVWLERFSAQVQPQPLFLPPQSTAAAAEPAPHRAPRAPRPVPDTGSKESSATTLTMLSGEAAKQAGEQIARELLYPPEAIARGLQGEALVLLFLDASGNAIAARLEASSGYALLDDAAVHAARTLRALPSSAPREALLPVRFRLR
jgi:protein TonB